MMFVLLSKFWRERKHGEGEQERERERKASDCAGDGNCTVSFCLIGCLCGCFLNRVSVSKECVCKSRKQSETARGKLRDIGLVCWERGRGEERRTLFENE